MAGRRRADDALTVTASSGNVFSDLGLPEAQDRKAKVKIAFALNTILAKLDLTQAKIAKKLNTDQPKVSALLNYKLDGLSVERLIGFLTALDYDVDINIKPKKPKQSRAGRINVRVKAA